MQSTVTTETTHSVDAVHGSASWANVLSGPRTEAWRQRLVKITLIFPDVVLASVIWEVACLLHILRPPGYLPGLIALPGYLSGIVFVSIAYPLRWFGWGSAPRRGSTPATAAWTILRSFGARPTLCWLPWRSWRSSLWRSRSGTPSGFDCPNTA